MNKNKQNKNEKQNEAIDIINKKNNDLNGTKTTFHHNAITKTK